MDNDFISITFNKYQGYDLVVHYWFYHIQWVYQKIQRKQFRKNTYKSRKSEKSENIKSRKISDRTKTSISSVISDWSGRYLQNKAKELPHKKSPNTKKKYQSNTEILKNIAKPRPWNCIETYKYSKTRQIQNQNRHTEKLTQQKDIKTSKKV